MLKSNLLHPCLAMFTKISTGKTVSTAIFAAAWIVGLGWGLKALASYENSPGRVGMAPVSWPLGSALTLSQDRDTLVMLAHPRCPCTTASLGELAQIMAHTQGKVRSYVVFLKPPNSGADWDDTGLRRAAAEIPDVTAVTDVDGAEARLFGAETSGHALLFDKQGHRLFNGGITASRGHAGDNPGESAIVSLVNDRTAVQTSTSVFGCSLRNPQQQTQTRCCK